MCSEVIHFNANQSFFLNQKPRQSSTIRLIVARGLATKKVQIILYKLYPAYSDYADNILLQLHKLLQDIGWCCRFPSAGGSNEIIIQPIPRAFRLSAIKKTPPP
jgi:hypothetical protein